MLVVQDDWVQYEETPVRRTAVRGGAACAQRIPVASTRRPAAADVRTRGPVVAPRSVVLAHRAERPKASRLRLTRRGRLVLVLLPAVSAVSIAVAWASTPIAQAASPVHTAVTHTAQPAGPE